MSVTRLLIKQLEEEKSTCRENPLLYGLCEDFISGAKRTIEEYAHCELRTQDKAIYDFLVKQLHIQEQKISVFDPKKLGHSIEHSIYANNIETFKQILSKEEKKFTIQYNCEYKLDKQVKVIVDRLKKLVSELDHFYQEHLILYPKKNLSLSLPNQTLIAGQQKSFSLNDGYSSNSLFNSLNSRFTVKAGYIASRAVVANILKELNFPNISYRTALNILNKAIEQLDNDPMYQIKYLGCLKNSLQEIFRESAKNVRFNDKPNICFFDKQDPVQNIKQNCEPENKIKYTEKRVNI